MMVASYSMKLRSIIRTRSLQNPFNRQLGAYKGKSEYASSNFFRHLGHVAQKNTAICCWEQERRK